MATLFSETWESTLAALQAKYVPSYSNPPLLTNGAPQQWVTDQKFAGTYAMKQVYTGTQYDNPPKGGGSIEFDFADQTQSEIWLTWYMRLSPGFITAGGSIGGSGTKIIYMYMKSLSTGSVHGWVGNFMWGGRAYSQSMQGIKDHRGPNGPGTGQAIPYDSENFLQNVQLVNHPDNGDWLCYEANYKLNTPGQSDGHYLLYITNMTQGGPTILAASHTGREFLDTTPGGLSPSDSRWYRLKFYRQDGLGTMWYDNVSVTTTRLGPSGSPPPADSTPPPVPSAPTLGSSLPLSVSWPAVTNPGDLAGYKVYRKLEACAGGGGYSLIATLGNVTSYSDVSIPQATTAVCVKVSSYDTTGNESAQSTGTGATLTPPTPTERVQLAAENFAGGDAADLGVDWDAGYTGSGAFKIVSNEAVASDLNTDVRETYNAITTPNDQWLQAKITKLTVNGGGGILLRWANAPTITGYFLKARPSSPSTRIDKYTAGVYANITGNDLVTWAAGDYIRAEVEGTNLRVYHIRAGVETQVLNATDSSFASGKVGLSLYSGSQNDMAFDDITIGGFAAAGDTFARIATVVTDATGADLTFTGLAHKVRYKNDLHPSTPVEVTGLGGVASYRLSKTWEPEITYACFEAQGSDGVWETALNPDSYICDGVTPTPPGDVTAPDAPTGLEFY